MSEKNEQPGENTPKTLTADEISEMVTGAVRSHTKREVQTALKSAFEELKLDEMIATAVQSIKPPEAPDIKPEGEGSTKPDPRLVALEERAAALETKYQAELKAREAAEQKSRDESSRAALRSALGPAFESHPNGSQVVDTVSQLLFDAQKRVKYDNDGRPTFTFRKSPGHGLEPEDMEFSIGDGVQQWLKSDDAKIFLPPPPAQSGQGGHAPPRQVTRQANGMPHYEGPARNDDERAARASEKENALRSRLGI